MPLGWSSLPRSTMLFTVASAFTYGSFFPWLASSPTIIGDIYDRPEQFALIFGANAILMALAILVVERLVRRYSTFPVILAQVCFLLVSAIVYVVVSLSSGGVPSFWLWFVLLSLLTAVNSSSSPLLQSMAMQPMSAIAGTAASVIGGVVFIAGAVLGWLIDRTLVDTVTPLGVGYLAYGIGIAAMVLLVKSTQAHRLAEVAQ